MAQVTLQGPASYVWRNYSFKLGETKPVTKPADIAYFESNRFFRVVHEKLAPSPMAAADKIVDEEPGQPAPRTRKPKPRRPVSSGRR